jgi:tRNA uridine 5-carboxymethylaminomethyl modification enzyme
MKTHVKAQNEFDVIVVGAGHAGIEAALATARLGLKTLLLSMNLDTVGLMPCNTSIGGPGKGHLVREIDALGGEMARNTDETYIHIRMLNTSKGPAVQALRAQVDKKRYQFRLKHVLELQNNVFLRQGMATKLITHENYANGVEIDTGESFYSHAVILTTGTFLNGIIHIGEKRFPAGRLGEFPAKGMTESLKELGFSIGRLKTGTVARINSKQIDFSKCREQKPSSEPLAFSFFSPKVVRPNQVSCWVTHTTSRTHEIIRSNFHRAPLFSGQIEGVGPRYCPSIEDKINKFPDRDQHQVFLEQEGLDTNEIYMQGLSTSLPIDVQQEFINSIPGLESVEIMRPGYAIEYDFSFPTQLKPTLETKNIANLYLAGQINGTSGYEEAAAQGLVAGLNATASILGLKPLILGRDEAYAGVLIDDLVTKGTNEPYRLFTSRAEYRLSIRFDNSDTRLCKYGHEYGLLTDSQYNSIKEKQENIACEMKRLNSFHVKPNDNPDFAPLVSKSLYQAIKSPEVEYENLAELDPDFIPIDGDEIRNRVAIEIKYEGYIDKQRKQINDYRRFEEIRIRDDFDYDLLHNISTEARIKLKAVRPLSVGQASRISGISPADITTLIYFLKREKASSKQKDDFLLISCFSEMSILLSNFLLIKEI